MWLKLTTISGEVVAYNADHILSIGKSKDGTYLFFKHQIAGKDTKIVVKENFDGVCALIEARATE